MEIFIPVGQGSRDPLKLHHRSVRATHSRAKTINKRLKIKLALTTTMSFNMDITINICVYLVPWLPGLVLLSLSIAFRCILRPIRDSLPSQIVPRKWFTV